MSPSVLAIFRVNPIQLGQCVDEALQREAAHVLSGQSDHEGGSTEVVASGLPQGPDPFMPNTDSPAQLPSGKKAADKLRRQKKRLERRAQYPSTPRFSNSKKYKHLEPIAVDFNARELAAAKGAFVSLRQRCSTSREWTLDELVASGLKVVEWDGRSVFLVLTSHACLIPLRTPTAIIDQEDRVMTVLAGRPDGEDWSQVHARMSALLEQAGANIPGPRTERRGNFVSLSTGVSYGGGQMASIRFVHPLVLLSHTSRRLGTSLTGQLTRPLSTACARIPISSVLPGS